MRSPSYRTMRTRLSLRARGRRHQAVLLACGQPGARWTTLASAPCCRAPVKRPVAKARGGKCKMSPTGFPVGLIQLFDVGGDLLSHTLAGAVPSALEGLAS